MPSDASPPADIVVQGSLVVVKGHDKCSPISIVRSITELPPRKPHDLL